jgi:molecular chaperone HscC
MPGWCADAHSQCAGLAADPSAVSIDDKGAVLVGLPAREGLSNLPDRSIAAFKRYKGANRTFKLGKRTFRAEELSALVLRSLKDDTGR